MNSVTRTIAAYLLASAVAVSVMLPFRADILAAVPHPPLWAVPGMIPTSIALFVLWAWLWTNRPEGVFGR